MHPHWSSRALAALLLFWFAVITVEPAAFHACPVHCSAAAAEAVGAAHVHGANASEGTTHSDSHELPGRDRDHRICTCIGHCSAVGIAGTMPAAPGVLALPTPRQIQVEFPAPDSPVITAPPFFLPYANGPPVGPRVA